MQVEDDKDFYNRSSRRIRKAATGASMPDAKRQMSASPASIMDTTIAQDAPAPAVVVPSADDVLIQVSASLSLCRNSLSRKSFGALHANADEKVLARRS